MTDTEKQDVKEQLESYLQERGVDTTKPFRCLNPEHEDKNPSMSFNSKNGIQVKCFGCGLSYDIFDLIGIDYGLTDDKEIFNKASELYLNLLTDNKSKPIRIKQNAKDEKEEGVITIESKKDYIKQCQQQLKESSAHDYLVNRGIKEEVFTPYRLGYDPEYKTKNPDTGKYEYWQVLVIPNEKGITYRNIDEKVTENNRFRKEGPQGLFNPAALLTGQPVIIVESDIDALSVITAGGHAVSIGSTSGVNKLRESLKKQPTAGTLILSLDNDEAGKKATEELITSLERLGIGYVCENISGTYKDPNEHLMKDKDCFVKEVTAAIKQAEENAQQSRSAELTEYQKTSLANQINTLLHQIENSANTLCVPTNFENIDKGVLDGGLYPGLYVIGAESSLGKTTFVLQMADQISEAGTDVLFISLEMSRLELMAKSISRLTFINDAVGKKNAKTVRGILDGKRCVNYNEGERNLIINSTEEYRGIAKNIYVIEGEGNSTVERIRKDVERHIRLTGKKPVLIVDYLQILTVHDNRLTDKQSTDRSITELKRISRDFTIPVIAISSFNRNSYDKEVSMSAYKESGAIEYSSDVLIALAYKVDHDGNGNDGNQIKEIKREIEKNPKKSVPIQLRVLKNRNGAKGKAFYEYHQMFNYFEEKKNAGS